MYMCRYLRHVNIRHIHLFSVHAQAIQGRHFVLDTDMYSTKRISIIYDKEDLNTFSSTYKCALWCKYTRTDDNYAAR